MVSLIFVQLKSFLRQFCFVSLVCAGVFFVFFINPLRADITESVKLIPDDSAYGDYFGSSVAISGNYAIVGAPSADISVGELEILNCGCAYIFERTKGFWSQKAKLQAADIAPNDVFGSSVSISGDYAIVGAPFDDHTGSNYGSAYIFKRTEPLPGTILWNQVAKLVALTPKGLSDGGTNDFFGTSVAISGNYAVVGAPNDDDNGTDSGSVYVYQLVDGTWGFRKKLTAPDAAAGDLFGYSVAISGDDVVVGAPRDDREAATDIGSIYFFKGSGETWGAPMPLPVGLGAAGDQFGWSVAIDGHYTVGGAPYFDSQGDLSNAGSALVYEELNDTGLWYSIYNVRLEASDAEASDQFGIAVSISGDYVLIGSLKYTHGTGTAYVFKKNTSGDQWAQFEKLIPSDTPWGFASAVSLSGGYAIIGAKHDRNSFGSAYVYEIFSTPEPPPPAANVNLPWLPLLLLD